MKLRTPEDVVAFFGKNGDKKQSGLAQALWWSAYRQAQSCYDSRVKDLANMFLEGVKATNLDDIASDIECEREDIMYELDLADDETLSEQDEEKIDKVFAKRILEWINE